MGLAEGLGPLEPGQTLKAPARCLANLRSAMSLLREETSGRPERAASTEWPARTTGAQTPVAQGRDRPIPSLSRPLPGLPTPYSKCLQTLNTQCLCLCTDLGALPSFSSPTSGDLRGVRGTEFQRVEQPGEP